MIHECCRRVRVLVLACVEHGAQSRFARGTRAAAARAACPPLTSLYSPNSVASTSATAPASAPCESASVARGFAWRSYSHAPPHVGTWRPTPARKATCQQSRSAARRAASRTSIVRPRGSLRRGSCFSPRYTLLCTTRFTIGCAKPARGEHAGTMRGVASRAPRASSRCVLRGRRCTPRRA